MATLIVFVLCASTGVVHFIRGYALWSKMVMLGVVRGLCADFPWGPHFRTEASPHWCSTLAISSYQFIAVIFALPVTLYYVLGRSTGFLGGKLPLGCMQGCKQGTFQEIPNTFPEYLQVIPRTCSGLSRIMSRTCPELSGHMLIRGVVRKVVCACVRGGT